VGARSRKEAGKLMQEVVLYCCSYARDVARARRMAESVARHNRGGLALYVSAPRGEEQLFRNELGSLATIFCRDEILAANARLDPARVYALPGIVHQQVIKSEFWRLGVADTTVVLDSDCKFIRDFWRTDFMAAPHVPFTVMHDGAELLRFAARHGPRRVRAEFVKDREPIRRELGRDGRLHDYGYAPYLWSRRVWMDLEEKHLAPRGETLLDAIVRAPSEFTWYGEALLRFGSIPLHARGPLFRYYHYEHEHWLDGRRGVTEASLARDYAGVAYQSNWETWTDFGPPTKSLPSRVARRVKRTVKRLLISTRAP
jgi:hypothetical protein